MNLFEYVMALVSIIVGLGMTHLLQGVLDIIQERTRIYWVHLMWVGWAFIEAVFWWWWEFKFNQTEHWTFPLYMFVIAYAFLIYIMCGLLFPKNLDAYGDFKTYFYARRRWFFGVLAAIIAVDFIDTAVKGMDYFLALGPEYTFGSIVLIASFIAGAILKNERFHAVLSVVLFVYQLSWALRFFYAV